MQLYNLISNHAIVLLLPLITGTQHTFSHSHGYAFLHSAILAPIMCVLFYSAGVKHQFHLATNKGGGEIHI